MQDSEVKREYSYYLLSTLLYMLFNIKIVSAL